MWSANSGNGYFGGLQLTQEMWDQNGGSAYAPRPDLASRSQQIAIAEKILDGKGPGTWSSCAAGPGLSKGSAAPEVDPGRATPEPQPSHTDEPEHTTPATPRTRRHHAVHPARRVGQAGARQERSARHRDAVPLRARCVGAAGERQAPQGPLGRPH
ncbi:hypothetical protein GCM10020000_48490 [Streptomyces olivoverticillatus]